MSTSNNLEVVSNKHISRKNSHWTRRKRIQLFYQYEGKCYWCGKQLEFNVATLEHIIPKSIGGTNAYENLTIACQSCNSKKVNYKRLGLPIPK